jgi:alpha-tubulin suppressor-like RCC1 family protein
MSPAEGEVMRLLTSLGLLCITFTAVALAAGCGSPAAEADDRSSEGISIDDTGGNPVPRKPDAGAPTSPAPLPINRFTSIATGANTSFAIGMTYDVYTETTLVALYARGQDTNDQLGDAPDASARVSTNQVETLGLTWNTVNIWPEGSGTPTSPMNPGDPLSAVAAGDSDACAIVNGGTVECWGTIATSPSNVALSKPTAIALPAGIEAAQIVHGQNHACALASSLHAVYCWGNNDKGQLGDATSSAGRVAPHLVPLTLPSGGSVATIAAGGRSTCALESNGSIWCWGDNERGSLGNARGVIAPAPGSAASYTATPQQVVAPADGFGDPVPFSLPVSGGSPTLFGGGAGTFCAQTMSGLFCWGANDQGQAGVMVGGENLTADVTSPLPTQPVVSGATLVALGSNHSCVLNGVVSCFGANNFGQLGIGHASATPVLTATQLVETQVASTVAPGDFWSISVGLNHSCGFAPGYIDCWGDDSYGQIGTVGTQSAYEPIITFH